MGILRLAHPCQRRLYKFIRLLNEREQRTLILLAHHCVLLKREEGVWYLDGHARRLLSTIKATLHEDMKRRIKWQCIEIQEDQVMSESWSFVVQN
jgi:hypothetical protein